MSVSKWAWTPECDNDACPGDCDLCSSVYDDECEECEVDNDG